MALGTLCESAKLPRVRNDGFEDQMINEVELQYSDDALAWVAVESMTFGTGWSTAEQRVRTATGAASQDVLEVDHMTAHAVLGVEQID